MGKKVVTVVLVLASAVIGAIVTGRKMRKTVVETTFREDRNRELFQMMTQWVKVKQKGKGLSLYFEKNGYKKIAIYGMGNVGLTLLDELKGTDVEVAYGIDKRADAIYADIDIVTVENIPEEVDAVIVTAISFFNEIAEALRTKIKCPVISLEEILYDI